MSPFSSQNALGQAGYSQDMADYLNNLTPEQLMALGVDFNTSGLARRDLGSLNPLNESGGLAYTPEQLYQMSQYQNIQGADFAFDNSAGQLKYIADPMNFDDQNNQAYETAPLWATRNEMDGVNDLYRYRSDGEFVEGHQNAPPSKFAQFINDAAPYVVGAAFGGGLAAGAGALGGAGATAAGTASGTGSLMGPGASLAAAESAAGLTSAAGGGAAALGGGAGLAGTAGTAASGILGQSPAGATFAGHGVGGAGIGTAGTAGTVGATGAGAAGLVGTAGTTGATGAAGSSLSGLLGQAAPSLIGAGASLLGANAASNAAGDAIDAQTDAARYATDLARDQWDMQQQNYEPYRQLGEQATPMLSDYVGGAEGEMSPDLQKVAGYVDQMGGLNSQFQMQDFGDGQYQLDPLAAPEVGNAFGDQYVDPNLNILEGLEDDPIVKFMRDQARKSSLQGLSAEGMIGSSAGIDRTMFADQSVLANEVDRRMYREQELNNRMIGNETRGYQSELSNYGRDTDTANRQQSNALLGYQNQVDNYGRSRDNALLGYDTDVANYGRQYGQLQDQASQYNSLGNQMYGRIGDLSGIGQNAVAGLGAAGQNFANNTGGIAQSEANALGSIYGANARSDSQMYNTLGNIGGTLASQFYNPSAVNTQTYQPQAVNTQPYNPSGYQSNDWIGR